MVRSITQLARGMGLTTIAEFVGDAATQSLLGEYDVDMVQGFHLGYPMDASSLMPAGAGRLPDA
jgi:EAL domain-containing protein (putative c-di-GMP-specific phosphodiesterase class I)